MLRMVSGRHGKPDVRHLGEIRPLAAEKVSEILVSHGEVIHKLRHGKIPDYDGI